MNISKFLVGIIMLFPSISVSSPILDQANDGFVFATVAAPDPYSEAGQSFRIGISGILHSIELLGWNQATAFPADREHTLSIYSIGSIYTIENAIASVTQTADSYSEHWFKFDFSGLNIFVESGDEYLMLWSTDSGYFSWRQNSFAYDRGDRFIRNSSYPDGTFVENRDQIFRTYVTQVPEPPALFLLSIGIVLLITKSSTTLVPRSDALTRAG